MLLLFWVIYSKTIFIFLDSIIAFVWPFFVVFNCFKKSSSVSVIISPLLPPFPLSSTGTLCHLTSLAHYSCCLQPHHFRFSLCFVFLAALRNQLFCIYFMVIWAFWFFSHFLLHSTHFIVSFPFGGEFLKINPIFDVYFRFKLEQIFSFCLVFLGGGE